MGYRKGFGVVKGLISLSNPKLVCALKSQMPQHITSITASLSVALGFTTPTAIDAVMVQVVNGLFDDNYDNSPDAELVDDWAISGANSTPQSICQWEARWNCPQNGEYNKHWYFGERGLIVPANTDVAVIMSAPEIAGAPLPSGIWDEGIFVLSVNGWIEDKANPFKELKSYQNA